jgi:hypothetical protein
MSRYLLTVALGLVIVFSSQANANAAETPRHQLRVLQWQFAVSWECKSDTGVFLAGGRETYRVRITDISTPRYPSLEQGWPPELTVKAGQWDGAHFLANPQLLDQLQMARVVGWRDYVDDSLARAKGAMSHSQSVYGVCYNFSITLPTQHAGQRFYLQTTYDSPETGRMTCLNPVDVTVPCNEKARQRMQGSYVSEANFRGDNRRAVEIADSLIALGWHDMWGLCMAEQSAIELHRLDKALQFLDLNFQTNGRIEASFDGQGGDSDRQNQARLYREYRQQLLKEIDQQRNQQEMK